MMISHVVAPVCLMRMAASVPRGSGCAYFGDGVMGGAPLIVVPGGSVTVSLNA